MNNLLDSETKHVLLVKIYVYDLYKIIKFIIAAIFLVFFQRARMFRKIKGNIKILLIAKGKHKLILESKEICLWGYPCQIA